jgi:hypothetical protein
MPPPSQVFDPKRWGSIGAFYLQREPDWVRRHVETIDVTGARFGRRHLTIDFTIPSAQEAIVRPGSPGHLYCVPVALLGKRTPRSKIDFVDEDGRRLPLLSRRENALISVFAVREALTSAIKTDPPRAMDDALLGLIPQSGRTALFQFYLFEYAAKKELQQFTRSEAWRHIRRATESLVNDSIVWLPILGQPGERRSVRLAYQVGLGPPSLIKQHLVERDEPVSLPEGEVVLQIPRPSGIDYSETMRRAASRIGVRLGVSAIDLEIRGPAVEGTASYHLQVDAPPGLELRRLRLAGKVRARPGAELDVIPFVTPQGGHLYLAGHEVASPGPVLAALRPARTGLISQAALSCGLIATMLWFFAAHWEQVTGPERAPTAAAILLIAPALLTAFVYRPSEHLLAARLLAGVRGLVLLAGAMSVCAAGSLVGAVRLGFSPQDGAYIFASGASLAASWLMMVWVSLLPWASVAESRRRWWTQFEVSRASWAAVTVLAALWAGALLLVARTPGPLSPLSERLENVIILVALAPWPLLFISGLGVSVVRGRSAVALRVGSFALAVLIALAGLAQLVLQTKLGHLVDDVAMAASGLVVLAGAAILAQAAVTSRGRPDGAG